MAGGDRPRHHAVVDAVAASSVTLPLRLATVLARRLDAEAPGTRIELTGPWAPYSFALPDDEEPA